MIYTTRRNFRSIVVIACVAVASLETMYFTQVALKDNGDASVLVWVNLRVGAIGQAGQGVANARRRRGRPRPVAGGERVDPANVELPPVCPHHLEPARPAPAAAGNGNPAAVFEQMANRFAENPAGGMPSILRDQEVAELQGRPLNVEEERRIGRSRRERYVADAARRGFALNGNARDLAYLRSLVDRFQGHMVHGDRYPRIEIALIDAPMPDGHAFPGGSVVFTTGLLETADEATVAGVVAHELAHLDLGHVEYYARREHFAANAFSGNDPREFADPTRMMRKGMAIGSLFANPYLPEHELAADCQATTWMYLEGYDPKALARFFEGLNRRLRDQPDGRFVPSWRSHPYSLDRRDEVLDRLEQLQRWRPRQDLGLFPDRLRGRERVPAGPPPAR